MLISRSKASQSFSNAPLESKDMRKYLPFVALVPGAVALIANPLYLDGLLIYPVSGDGFNVGPQYHAALAGLGLLVLLSAAIWLLPVEIHDETELVILGSALGVITVYVLYQWIVGVSMDPRETYLLGSGHRKTLIVSTLVVVFTIGAGVTAREPQIGFLAPLLYLPGILLVLVEPRSLFPTILDHLLLVASSDLLGIPLLGGLVLLAAAVYGSWFGWLIRTS